MAYDRKKAEELVKKVLDKLDKSNAVYKDAYVLNDIARETDEELLDIIGWPLMEVLRLQETLQKVIYSADNIYWEKFLKNQKFEFLQILLHRIAQELGKRERATEQELVTLQRELLGAV
jgi:hypothetical protein